MVITQAHVVVAQAPVVVAQTSVVVTQAPVVVAQTPVADFLGDAMQLVIFTDIDGSLLDFRTYESGPAAVALEACRRTGVPVIPCTSKSSVEVLALRRRLGLETPFIVENGAAVYFPADTPVAEAAEQLARSGKWDAGSIEMVTGGLAGGEEWEEGAQETFSRLLLGAGRARIVEALEEIAGELRLHVRGISEMTDTEIVERTGLPPAQARAARTREFSEPFVIMEDAKRYGEEDHLALLKLLQHAAEERGLTCTLGGRFFHLQGNHTKGTAVERTILCYAEAYPRSAGSCTHGETDRLRAMALGDAYNDAEMLAAVDEPVLIRRPDGTYADGIVLPRIVRTTGVGPQGWYEAVMARLDVLSSAGD